MDEDYLIVPSGPPESYCRLCLSEANIEPLLVVPDGFLQPNQGLVDLIKRYVEIGLSGSRDSPCAICSTCRMMLEEFERFRERCLRCDYILTGQERNVQLECGECPSRFRFKVEFERHWKSYHDLVYRCGSCEAGFSTQAMLDGHREKYHESRIGECFHCNFCPRIFADESQLQFHVQLLHTTTTPVTDFAPPPAKKPRKPSRKSNAPIQPDPTNPDRPYECRTCRVRFSFIGSLTRHLAEKHKNTVRRPLKPRKPAKVASTIQPASIFAEETLMPEVMIQEVEPTLTMEFNGENPNNHFSDQHYSDQTIEQPSVVTPFVIALSRLDSSLIPPIPNYEIPLGKYYHALQKQTANSIEDSALDDEILMNYPTFTRQVHKVIRCDQCPAEFPDKRRFDRHKAIKHEGAMHTCPECFRQFPDKSSLDRHSYLHTNDFPFVCDECPLGFVRQSLLNQHKKKTHYPGAPPQQLFYCPYCSRPFSAKQKVKAHIVFLHSDQCDDLYNLPY